MKEYLIAFLGGIVVGGACNDCLAPRARSQYESVQEAPYMVPRPSELQASIQERIQHWSDVNAQAELERAERKREMLKRADEKFGHWKEKIEERERTRGEYHVR